MSLPNSKEQSLLDDASTLLLFSKGNKPEEALTADSKAGIAGSEDDYERKKKGAVAMGSCSASYSCVSSFTFEKICPANDTESNHSYYTEEKKETEKQCPMASP